MMWQFEAWFKQQSFYLNMRFIYGDQLFTSENDVYRVLAVQIAWFTWQEQQKKIDNIKTKSIEQALKLSGMSERNNKQAEIIKDQQKRIDELETGSLLQSNHIAELTVNIKQAVADLNSRKTRINLLIQKWEKDAEYADQIAREDFVQNTLNGCIEELRQALKGDMNEQHINR